MRVAKAGDVIEESPGVNASAAANGAGGASEEMTTMGSCEVTGCRIRICSNNCNCNCNGCGCGCGCGSAVYQL